MKEKEEMFPGQVPTLFLPPGPLPQGGLSPYNSWSHLSPTECLTFFFLGGGFFKKNICLFKTKEMCLIYR